MHRWLTPRRAAPAFLDDSLHRLAFDRLRRNAKHVERFFEPRYVLLGLTEVRANRFSKFNGCGLRFHLWQSLNKLLFSTVEVLEFMHHEIVQRCDDGHGYRSSFQHSGIRSLEFT